jgi:hypothetical protein
MRGAPVESRPGGSSDRSRDRVLDLLRRSPGGLGVAELA